MYVDRFSAAFLFIFSILQRCEEGSLLTVVGITWPAFAFKQCQRFHSLRLHTWQLSRQWNMYPWLHRLCCEDVWHVDMAEQALGFWKLPLRRQYYSVWHRNRLFFLTFFKHCEYFSHLEMERKTKLAFGHNIISRIVNVAFDATC